MHHNLELAGHQGHKRMIEQIASNFYWPGMTRDAIRWVASCSACKKRKTPRPMRHGITEPMFATFPNQTVAIDIVGPLTETTAGNFWILTMIDVKASICQKGVPATIVSDQGRELISRGVKSLCTRVGIRKIQTSGYNPTGNASVERFHRFLMASLSILHPCGMGLNYCHQCFLPIVLLKMIPHETGRRPTLPLGCLVGNLTPLFQSRIEKASSSWQCYRAEFPRIVSDQAC